MRRLLFLLLLSQIVLFGAANKYIPLIENHNAVDRKISNATELIFYRSGENNEIVSTLKVNNHVVGSLLPNSYAKTYVCNKNVKIEIVTGRRNG